MTPHPVVASLAGPAILTLTVITVGYLLTCVAWPFGACRRCHGTGRRRSPLIRAYRICRRCDGTGLRLRIGRHLWNHLSRRYRNGTR